MFDVVEASIADLRRALDAGDTTAVELVDAYLARISAFDAPGKRRSKSSCCARTLSPDSGGIPPRIARVGCPAVWVSI